MNKSYLKSALLLVIVMCIFCGCRHHSSSDNVPVQSESSLDSTPLITEFPADITDLRFSVKARPYDVPRVVASDFQHLTMLQISYGYYSDGKWFDHPSENYDLKGILGYETWSGWEAGVGSHMVKIGPYLLICVSLPEDPMVEYSVSDTLDTEILYPFAEYVTYHYYRDADGVAHFHKDAHNHGYGYIAENPAAAKDAEAAPSIASCEFLRRYYVILDYETIPKDYVLTISQTSEIAKKEKLETLTYDMIKDVMESNAH